MSKSCSTRFVQHFFHLAKEMFCILPATYVSVHLFLRLWCSSALEQRGWSIPRALLDPTGQSPRTAGQKSVLPLL